MQNAMTWAQLKAYLADATEEQLSKNVVALIDGEPWEPSCYQIAASNDPDYPNTPYLLFE